MDFRPWHRLSVNTHTLYGGVLYFGSSDGNIFALNATIGLRLWNYTLPMDTQYIDQSLSGKPLYEYHNWVGSPIVYEAILYVGGGGSIYALEVASPIAQPPSEPDLSAFPIIIGIIAVVTTVVVCCGNLPAKK
ncbi:MAG: PQQ-like beta-propeller repeat protein [Nitrososphaerota archaeon]|nr:PQQ-like beta-propeller repeat protein [Nitrososphaerota archaeon]